MSVESMDLDPYAVVLADLKAKRDQIDQAIQAIESVRVGGSQAPAAAASGRVQEVALEDGVFHGLSISEATKKLLGIKKKQMNNTEILAALKAGGMVLTSADPLNTVGAVLTRRFKETGDIVKVDRGTWGLKEWYPGNRAWKKEPGKSDNPKDEAGESPKKGGLFSRARTATEKASEPEEP